jgi:hypothetical protein
MTTVIDPGTGSEAVVFNKSGTAILNVTLSITGATVFAIPAIASRVIVNVINPVIPPLVYGEVYPGLPSPAFNLDPNFQIGDEVWVLSHTSITQPQFEVSVSLNDEAGNLLTQEVGSGVIKIANGSGTPPNWLVMSAVSST